MPKTEEQGTLRFHPETEFDIAIKILLNVTEDQNFNRYLVKRKKYKKISITIRLSPLLEPFVLA